MNRPIGFVQSTRTKTIKTNNLKTSVVSEESKNQ